MPPTGQLVITGASGSGKTAIVEALRRAPVPRVTFHHFDSIGVPTIDQMTAQYGSPEAWQVAWTHKWVTRLAQEPGLGQLAVLEGQVRPSVVQEAFRANRVHRGRILLLDCRPEIRAHRLGTLRQQPDLAGPQMTAWAAYLRGQADALHVPTLDTSDLSLEEAIEQVRRHIAQVAAALAAEAPVPERL